MTREQAVPQIEEIRKRCEELIEIEKVVDFEKLLSALHNRVDVLREGVKWSTPEDEKTANAEIRRLSTLIAATESIQRCVRYAKLRKNGEV